MLMNLVSAEAGIGEGCDSKQEPTESIKYVQETTVPRIHEEVSNLYSVWSKMLNEWINEEAHLPQSRKLSNVPKAPHLVNCKLQAEVNHRLDTTAENEAFPPWTIWKGMLDNFQPLASLEQQIYTRHPSVSNGTHPPWVCNVN